MKRSTLSFPKPVQLFVGMAPAFYHLGFRRWIGLIVREIFQGRAHIADASFQLFD